MARFRWFRRARGRHSAVDLVGSAGGPPDLRLRRAREPVPDEAPTPSPVEDTPPAPHFAVVPAVVPAVVSDVAPDVAPDVAVVVEVPAPRVPEPSPSPAVPTVRIPAPLPTLPAPAATRVSLGFGDEPLLPLSADDPVAADLAATVDRLLGDAVSPSRRGQARS